MHIGRKIGRIRELRGLKQEFVALELGVSQQTISKMEQSENIDLETLERVAKILGVTEDAIKNFNEDAVFNYFNNFSDNSINQGPIGAHNICNFNPIEKLVQLFEENKMLYERLLKSEQEKNEILRNK